MSGRTFGIQSNWGDVFRILGLDLDATKQRQAASVADSMNGQIEEFLNRYVATFTNDSGDFTFDATGTFTFDGDVTLNGELTVAGDITLSGSGTVRTGAATDSRWQFRTLVVVGLDDSAVLQGYTGHTDEVSPASFQTYMDTSGANDIPTLIMRSPQNGASGNPSTIVLYGDDNGVIDREILFQSDQVVTALNNYFHIDVDVSTEGDLIFGAENTKVDYISHSGTYFSMVGNSSESHRFNDDGDVRTKGDRFTFHYVPASRQFLLSRGYNTTTPGFGFYGYDSVGPTSREFLTIEMHGTTKKAVITNVDEINAEDGSAGDPSYTFTNDTDTGMFLAGTGDLRLSVGGSSKLRLTATGAYMQEAYDNAAAGTPNLYVNSAGLFFRDNSTWDGKKDIKLLPEHQEGKRLLKNYQHLMPVAFQSTKGQKQKMFGFIHEWSPGRLKGNPDDKSVDTRAYLALTVAKVQELERRIDRLESGPRDKIDT